VTDATPAVAVELARIRRLAEPPLRLSGRVLAALASGEATSGALAARLGVPHGSVQDALADLARRGRVARAGKGPAPVYRACARGR
jgi:predicted ArsR family transcriptional regulator